MSSSEDAQTFCGTAPNMAPEVLAGKRYNEKADVWSMGTIIFQLITGNVPFEGSNPFQVLQNIMKGLIRFPADVAISNNCKSLIHSLLLSNSEKRYSWKEYLEHPFVKTKPEEYLLYLREIFGPNYGAVLSSPKIGIGSSGKFNINENNNEFKIHDEVKYNDPSNFSFN